MNDAHDSTSRGGSQRRHAWTDYAGATPGLVFVIAVVSLILGLMGDPARVWLRYDRAAILDMHQYWRLFTGHLVHADTRHLLLNLAGLALIAALCRGCYTFRQWLAVSLVTVVAIDAGFLLFMPNLGWYVGLSGVLHGLLAAGAVRWWRIETPWLAASLSIVLVGKLAWEQWQGALPLAGDLQVIVNAHLYGALGGALSGLWLVWRGQNLSGSGAVT